MASYQANVFYTNTDPSVFPVTWATDKARIAVVGEPTAYIRYQVQLPGYAFDTGNIYQPSGGGIVPGPYIPAGQTKDIFVGVGNLLYITVEGDAIASATELGTASSSQAGVIGYGSV